MSIDLSPELLADVRAKAERQLYVYPNRIVLAMIAEIEQLRCKNAELLDIIHRNILLPEYNDDPSRS